MQFKPLFLLLCLVPLDLRVFAYFDPVNPKYDGRMMILRLMDQRR